MTPPNRFDGRKLREEAIRAFAKALHTDRMVAVTGSMATRALGYPSWNEFVEAYAIIARALARQIYNRRDKGEPSLKDRPGGHLLLRIIERADRLSKTKDDHQNLDRRVAMWELHDSFRTLDQQMRNARSGLVINDRYQESALEIFEERVAAMFQSRLPEDGLPLESAIRPLIENLGIKRIATLNYDLELERAFMLRADEREIISRFERESGRHKDKSRAERFALQRPSQRRLISSVGHFIGDQASGKPILKVSRRRLSRTMGDGIHVESDVVDRQRPDRLFEFAVGSAETGRHLFHLHGRADVPSSLVANIRQYDRLYRLDDLYRDPFDHGLRMMLGGNPILFVGIGMTEPELNRILEWFQSNVPIRRPAPAFLLWNTTHLQDERERKRFMEDKRLDFRTRLGVHMLFDEDIVQPGDRKWLDDLRLPKKDRSEQELREAIYDVLKCWPKLDRIRTEPGELSPQAIRELRHDVATVDKAMTALKEKERIEAAAREAKEVAEGTRKAANRADRVELATVTADLLRRWPVLARIRMAPDQLAPDVRQSLRLDAIATNAMVDELKQIVKKQEKKAADEADRARKAGEASDTLKLRAVAATLAKLPDLVKRIDQRGARWGGWRNIRNRLAVGEHQHPGKPYRLWGSHKLHLYAETLLKTLRDEGKELDIPALAAPVTPPGPGEPPVSELTKRNLIFVAAQTGFGRGLLGECLVQMPQHEAEIVIGHAVLRKTQPVNRLIVNAGFSYDSDTMLIGIAEFLNRRIEDPPPGKHARERLFAEGTLFKTRGDCLVVINGADRFFSFDGTPLSAELDHMLRCALDDSNKRVQFMLLGTERLQRYCNAIGVGLDRLSPGMNLLSAVSEPSGETVSAPDVDDADYEEDSADLYETGIKSKYLEWVESRFERRAKIVDAKIGMRLRKKGLPDPEIRRLVERVKTSVSSAGIANINRAIKIDRETALNRTFYEAYLAPGLLTALGVHCAPAFEILRTMCFIGGPVEAAVLLHAPKVRAMLAESSKTKPPGTDVISDNKLRLRLASVISRLSDLGLLVELDPHEPPPSLDHPKGIETDENRGYYEMLRLDKRYRLLKRYVLHRSLATFLRDRHGAPINDAKLATTFNMSLFMSEPSDNYTPEPNFHDELGDLVDNLIGGWHDIERLYGRTPRQLVDPKSAMLKFGKQVEEIYVQLEELYIHPDDEDYAAKSLIPRSSRMAAATLRAAFSLVRNYYSTGALLKLDRNDRIASAERDGALTEHAQRLDRLITAFGDIATARSIVRKIFGVLEKAEIETARAEKDENDRQSALEETEKKSRNDAIDKRLAAARQKINDEMRQHMGPDPFYADDIVWLHNERGVVALTQGHMFDARESFSTARTFNNRFVERDYAGHNWRRISINLAATRIERGMLKPAERLLDEIEGTINAAPWRRGQDATPRVERIRAMFLSKKEPPLRGDKDHTREEILVVAMTTCYRGLIAHLRGRYHEAREHYETGIVILRRLGEQRAYAHFQRHFASLQNFIGEKLEAAREIGLAVNAAQSAKQMDILHRARVVRSNIARNLTTDPADRRQALQDVKDALKYAALSDCYRVRIEASASLARHMRDSGDYDTALRYAVDALTVASRYGHSLQKTQLRIEIGHILQARGDPVSGEALLEQAIAISTSKGYHQALERVRRARNLLAANPSMTNRTDIPIGN